MGCLACDSANAVVEVQRGALCSDCANTVIRAWDNESHPPYARLFNATAADFKRLAGVPNAEVTSGTHD